MGLAALGLALALAAPAAEPTLRFTRAGQEPAVVDAGALRAACAEETVAVADPFYEKPKRFLAWPLRCVLAQGFGAGTEALAGQEVLLRALDGYTRATSGAVLLEPGGYLAFAD